MRPHAGTGLGSQQSNTLTHWNGTAVRTENDMTYHKFFPAPELRNFEQGKRTSVPLDCLVAAVKTKGSRSPKDGAAYLTRKLAEPKTRQRLGLD